jgi:pimeloyl-ACP methyl ester carboxylesterase
MIAENRRGDAVRFFMKDMIGLPGIFILIMKLTPVWSKLKGVAHTLPFDAAVMGDYSLPEKKAASIRIPTLISGGDKSQISLQHAVKKLSEIMPNSRLQILKGQTHNVSEKVLAPVLAEFFKST